MQKQPICLSILEFEKSDTLTSLSKTAAGVHSYIRPFFYYFFPIIGDKVCFGIEIQICDNRLHLCILKAGENFNAYCLGLILNEDLKVH